MRTYTFLAVLAGILGQTVPAHAQLNSTYEECRSDWIRTYELKLENEPTEYGNKFVVAQHLPNLDRDAQNVWRMVTLRDLSLDDAISEHIEKFRGSFTSAQNDQLREQTFIAVAPLIELRDAITSTQHFSLNPEHHHINYLAKEFDVCMELIQDRIVYWKRQKSPLIIDDNILVATAIAEIDLEHRINRGVPIGVLPKLLSCMFWQDVFKWEVRIRRGQSEADQPDAYAILEEFQFWQQIIRGSFNDAFGIYRR
jgi:hypothetical protein